MCVDVVNIYVKCVPWLCRDVTYTQTHTHKCTLKQKKVVVVVVAVVVRTS